MLTRTQLSKRVDKLAERFARPQVEGIPDPVGLARRAALTPDEWQQDVLNSTATRILLNCSRQSGKSTVAAVMAAHTALSQAGSLTLLVSPTLRQSGELFRSARRVYHDAGGPGLVPLAAESALSLTLRNGSRIVSLPGREGHIRGYSSVSLLVLDEASRVPDELYASLRPMLAVSGGRLIALSTPFGSRGWWWEAWTSSEGWQRFEIPATLCPRISPEFLESERLALGNWWFSQEYECQFMDAQSAAFASSDVRAAFTDAENLLWPV